MKYINWKSSFGVETVDQADTLEEAEYLVAEYNMAYGGGCYISSRCTNHWKES